MKKADLGKHRFRSFGRRFFIDNDASVWGYVDCQCFMH